MDPIEAARRGDETAFLHIVDEHQPALFRFAFRLTGSTADAEDIVQECFLELLRPGCGYRSARSSLRTYLFGVVRNQSLKRLRTRDVAHAATHELSAGCSQESEVLSGELKGAVENAVMQLPETQRALLILAHFEQLPLIEIARAMNLETGAVKSRLQRARQSLKESLAAYAPGPETRR